MNVIPDGIGSENIIFVPSRSRLSLAIERAGSFSAAKQRFADKTRWERILEEDLALRQATDMLTMQLPTHKRIDRGQLGEIVHEGGLVILLGGDDFYTYCMGSIIAATNNQESKPLVVMGVNGKPRSSYGALLPFTVDDCITSVRKGNNSLLPTPYLAVSVQDGSRQYTAFPSVSQVVFLEASPADTSWNRVVLPDGSEPLVQGGSGIIAALKPGSGPRSWYANAGGQIIPSNAYGIVVREPNQPGARNVIVDQGVTTIYSANDSKGSIMPDAHKERTIPFPDGSIATLERCISEVYTMQPKL